jgi:uncharacterized protein (DUF488 family)
MRVSPPIFTIGHGRRTVDELIGCLREAGIEILVDVRRNPSSRRNPQFNQPALTARINEVGIPYRHAVELGGLRTDPGAERFACLRVEAFRSYAVRMGSTEWQAALAEALAGPAPCLMCATTPWRRRHRRLISELLVARGREVVHLLGLGEREPHRLYKQSDVRDGKLYVCGQLVA